MLSAQNTSPNTRATTEATAVGTNTAVASDDGPGAGASAAETAETAAKTTTTAKKNFILIASIFSGEDFGGKILWDSWKNEDKLSRAKQAQKNGGVRK